MTQRDRIAPGGYAEQRVELDRYRVTFTGNSFTSRETVERYLLYRAAELTLSEGYDWFSIAERYTDRQASSYVRSTSAYGGWAGSGFGHFGAHWGFYGHGHPGIGWGPGFGTGFANPVAMQTNESFEAMAEIVMRRGAKPGADSAAFDARAVVTDLGPRVQRSAPAA